jgi:biotin synthase-like enzyme
MEKYLPLFALLGIIVVSTFAAQQKTLPTQNQITPEQLDRAAAVPTTEQAILRAAADQLRQEKSPTAIVQLQLTVKITSTNACCKQYCVYRGATLLFCRPLPCTC